MTRKTRSNTRNTPPKYEDEMPVIDAVTLADEELPADLYDKIERFHGQLCEVRLQAKRNGRWGLLRQQLRLDMPTAMPVETICTHILEWAALDADRLGEADRYRARLYVQVDRTKKPVHRYAHLRATVDDEGAIALVDDSSNEEDKDIMAMLLDQRRHEQDFYFRTVEALVRTTEQIAADAEVLRTVLRTVAETRTSDVEGQVAVLRLQMEMQAGQWQHTQEMAKMEHLSKLLEKPIEKISEQAMIFMRDKMRNASQKKRDQKTSGAKSDDANAESKTPNAKQEPANVEQKTPDTEPEPAKPAPEHSDLAQRLDRAFAGMTTEQTAATLDLLTENEQDCIEHARKATTDQTFAVLYVRLLSEIKKRGDDGDELMKGLCEAMSPSAFVELFSLFESVQKLAA